jgi:hypothetical protein
MGTRQHDTDRRTLLVPASRLGIVAPPPLSASVRAAALPSLCGAIRPPGQGSLFLPS